MRQIKVITAAEFLASKPKQRAKPRHEEADLQMACVEWFRTQHPNGVLFACHQNGKDAREQERLGRMGLLPGVSDLIYLSPVGVVFIELKTKTGKQSDHQKAFERAVSELGYRYYLVRSFDEFQDIIEHTTAKIG